MHETERLSGLIGHVYDAALDRALWPSAVGQARAFVGGSAAALYARGAISKTGDLYCHDGDIDPRYTQLYFDTYIKLDPSAAGQFFAEIDQPVTTVGLMPYEEFLETRFYKEWARPQRLVDSVTAVLDKSMTSMAAFGVFRHERDGIADGDTYRRMRLIAPHMRRAVLIGRVIDLKSAEAATFIDALDKLSAGMFLVDATGRIVHLNAAGHALLATGRVLHAPGGRLTANDEVASEVLRDSFCAASQGDAAIGTKGIAVSLIAEDGERYVAYLLPLTSGARRRASASCAAVAALFVQKAGLETMSSPELIARTFKLTPTELRVLLGIIEVGGVPETAEALGIAETTVKTHLSRLFVKTGASRQADLVKLVAGFSNPLVG